MKIPNQHWSTTPLQKAAFPTEQSLHPTAPQMTTLRQAQQIKPTLLASLHPFAPPPLIHTLLLSMRTLFILHFPLFSPIIHLTT